jgi:predicted negative regulator of RcsB-dependent stress response
VSKKSEKAVKEPDVFISSSEHIYKWMERNAKPLLLLVGVAAVSAVVYATVGYLNAAKEQRAAEALYAPEATLKKAEADVRDERAKQTQALIADKTKKDAKAEVMHPADYEKDYAPAVAKIKEELKRHADTNAAMVSALNLSYFLSQQKQFAQALEVLDIPTSHAGTGELLGGFWLMHRGVMLIENGKVDEAIASYQSVVKSESLKVFYPEALLKLGLAYELKGDSTKARETYEKVGREFPETEASASAQQYIRLLELNAVKKG